LRAEPRVCAERAAQRVKWNDLKLDVAEETAWRNYMLSLGMASRRKVVWLDAETKSAPDLADEVVTHITGDLSWGT
jgi:hypothetical protein